MDPNLEISLETVKSRAVKGVLALTGRTLILNIIALVAQGFLWAYLDEYQFGVFWIVSAVVNFLVYFSDIGLAAALIQKKEKVSEDDLRTTFTVQQGLVIVLLAVLLVLSPILVRTQSLSSEGRTLLYALGFSFFLSSLKTIPSVLMERKLEFGKFILPQVLETFFYNIVVVYFAINGYGIASFSYAVIVRGVVGLVSVYILQPWMPKLGIKRKSLRELLRFGLPYQASSLLAVVKDDGVTIALGAILGPAGVGILGTAQRLAQYPLRFFMDNVTKVSFPAFSRMQDDRLQLARAVTRSIFFICFFVFPSVVGLVVLAPVLVDVIPRYEKWRPALLPLMLIGVNSMFAAFTTQLTNMLDAIGKVKTRFKLMVMWSVLTLLFVPLLAYFSGVVGASVGYMLVGVSSVVAVYIAYKLVPFSLVDGVVKPLVASGIMGGIIFAVRQMVPTSLVSFFVIVVVGCVCYAAASFLLVGPRLVDDVKRGIKAVLGR